MSKVLVTGASGFVGRHLCESLRLQGYEVHGTIRSEQTFSNLRISANHCIGDIGDKPDWSDALQNVDCVVHLAARAHVMREVEVNPLAAFRRANVHGTKHLIHSAALSGVKRLVFLSTIKTHGELTTVRPFSMSDALAPRDPYAQSKLEAEQLVQKLGAELGVETVIIRPPLVYGPGVGGNFARLLSLVDKGIPLPFGRVKNSRSFVSIENLCALIGVCISHPEAAGNRFLVSDNDDVSTPELIELMALSMCRPARLVPIPLPMLAWAARIFGQSASLSRLTGSLQVNIEDTMRILSWTPSTSFAAGIESTVRWYRESEHRD